jgi:hypothetical protein
MVDGSGGTVSMSLLGVHTTTRPPVSVATVRVANTGDVTLRLALVAVDDWSSAESVPVEPPEVDLRPGQHRDVLVRTRRPLMRPLSRQRAGAVSVYADVDGGLVAGPVYEVPPSISRLAVAVGVAVLLVGVGAFALRPDPPARQAAFPSATPAEPSPPPIDDGTLPADVVFDAPVPDDANTHMPVLVGRDRATVPLAAGGRVTAAVKVPSGWVVKRQVVGDPAGIRFRVSHVRAGEVRDLAPGVANPSFWVDRTGTRVLIDGRDGAPGAVSVVALPGVATEVTTELPAHVRVVGWLGDAVLVSVRDADGVWRYDRWRTDEHYAESPSLITGSFLGATASGVLTVHQRDGILDCIVQVADLMSWTQQAKRCGLGVPVDSELMLGRWSAVSPAGRFIAAPGPNGSAYFAPLPAMLGGRAGFAPTVGLPGPIADITWRDGFTAAMLVRGDDLRVWACAASGGACRAIPVNGPPGLVPVRLAARAPLDS